MIYQNSRYYNQLIDFVAFEDNGPSNAIVFYEFDEPGTVSWWNHTYVEGERLDQIAYKYYNRSDFWWLIPEYNPEITDFVSIAPGTILRIPRV